MYYECREGCKVIAGSGVARQAQGRGKCWAGLGKNEPHRCRKAGGKCRDGASTLQSGVKSQPAACHTYSCLLPALRKKKKQKQKTCPLRVKVKGTVLHNFLGFFVGYTRNT